MKRWVSVRDWFHRPGHSLTCQIGRGPHAHLELIPSSFWPIPTLIPAKKCRHNLLSFAIHVTFNAFNPCSCEDVWWVHNAEGVTPFVKRTCSATQALLMNALRDRLFRIPSKSTRGGHQWWGHHSEKTATCVWVWIPTHKRQITDHIRKIRPCVLGVSSHTVGDNWSVMRTLWCGVNVRIAWHRFWFSQNGIPLLHV